MSVLSLTVPTSRIETVGPVGTSVRARLYVAGEPARVVAPVAEIVVRRQGRLTEVRLGEPSLEDVFIHLTGRALG